jgi:hypothetical protein
VIPNRLKANEHVTPCQFQVGEVYAMDIVMSTGEGKVSVSNIIDMRKVFVDNNVFRRKSWRSNRQFSVETSMSSIH